MTTPHLVLAAALALASTAPGWALDRGVPPSLPQEDSSDRRRPDDAGSIPGAGSTAPAPVATLGISRADIATRRIALDGFVVAGYATVGDPGAGARYVAGGPGDFLAIRDAGGRWFRLDLASGRIPAGHVGVVAGDSTRAAANAAALNGLMAALGARGAGEVVLPPGVVFVGATLDNASDNVLVRGSGVLYAPYGTPVPPTSVVPTFAGTVLRHRTPSAANHVVNGGGFADMRVIGNRIATRLLEVDTVWGGTYHLRLENSVGAEAAYFVGRTLVGPCIQHADIDLSVEQTAPGAAFDAHAVVFAGDPTANVSINDKIRLDISHGNGDALVLVNADNNIIWQRAFRVSGGTGAAVRSKAGATEPVSARANVWRFLSANTAAIFEGTDKAASPSHGLIQHLDKDNGSPMPVLGPGARAPVPNVVSQYAPVVTAGTGTLGARATAAGLWTQEANGKVTAYVSITLPNGSAAGSYLRISLPTPKRAGMIEGSATGKEISVTSRALSGVVGDGEAVVQFYDGTFVGKNGMNLRLTLEYQG